MSSAAGAYPRSASFKGARLIRASVILAAVTCLYAGLFGGIGPLRFSSFLGSHPTGALKQRVIVASSFGAHDDVYMSVVDTLERILPASSIRVYTHGLRFGLDTDVLVDLDVYSARRGSEYVSAYELPAAVDTDWAGIGADMVILGTCEVDLPNWGPDLFKLWLQRHDDDKFDLVCIVHNTGDFNWRDNYAMDWARVGALRLLPISEHTSKAQHQRMVQLSDDPDRYHLGLTEVPIFTHIPILPIERMAAFNAHGRHPGKYIFSDREKGDGLGEQRALNQQAGSDSTGEADLFWGRRDGKILRDAVIQGSFDRGRRDYDGIMKDLLAELDADPAAWGYKAAGRDAPFVAANADNFILHLAGDGDDSNLIPDRLKNVVKVHKHLSYPDFFSLMSSMDIAVPAFSMGAYMIDIASSTVAMAMQVETPLLVTPRILSAYTYLSPATTITRPPTVREITAVKALRTGRFTHPARSYDHKHEQSYTDSAGFKALGVWKGQEAWKDTRAAAEAMIAKGWTRGEAGWRKFKKGIYRDNERVLRELLSL